MRAAYFEPIGGAAGDMIIGSLLDAGLSLVSLSQESTKLPISHYKLRSERVTKQAVAATQLYVDVGVADFHHHERHQETSGEDESFKKIELVIRNSSLNSRVRNASLSIVRRLAAAEAKAQGLAVVDVRIDRAAMIDSLVDIVGAVIALDLLGVEQVFCSRLSINHGVIVTSHGTISIPAPAVTELLSESNAPVTLDGASGVQITSTGAAILTTLGSFTRPALSIDCTGFGAGNSDLEVPNVLRVSIGECNRSAVGRRRSVDRVSAEF